MTLAATMIAIPSHSWPDSHWPRMSIPARAANTGWTLENVPKNCAGRYRSAVRSAAYGTAEDSTPAITAVEPEPDEHRQVRRGRDQAGHGGRLEPRQPPAGDLVDEDVTRPGRGGDEGETDTDQVAGRSRQHQDVHPGRGDSGQQHLPHPPRGEQGDGQRTEELQRDGQPEPDPLDR
jgi:hypothetical protein